MSTIIAIASGKGGVGKTFVTATLSIALQRQGYHVLAVDADMGLRNLDLLFGMQDEVLYDIGDVMKKRCKPDDAILHVADGLDFLAASQKHTWEKIDAPTYQYIVETLAKPYDYTIIDCPPGRGRAYKNAVSIVDRLFFVVEPTWSSMRDTARLMQFCNKHKRFNYDILFNNFYRKDPGYVAVEEMMQLLNPEHVAGVLPHDPVVHEAAQRGSLCNVASTVPLYKALDKTVAYITEGTAPVMSELVSLLPEREEVVGLPEEAGEAVPAVAAEEPLGNLGKMKALAAAELQKAAAIWNGNEDLADDDDEDVLTEPVVQPARLSLRNRKKQSMAWRHYRR